MEVFTTKGIMKHLGTKSLRKVENQTCSVLCMHCKEPVWFNEMLVSRTPKTFICPNCGKGSINKFHSKR